MTTSKGRPTAATPEGSPERTTAVFLMDDHEVVRRGVANLIDAAGDMRVVGEAGTASQAMSIVRQCVPDVAVLDVRLGDGSGIDVCQQIHDELPEVRCLMLTSFVEDRAMIDASLAGAAGFVVKQIAGDELVESIRKVAAGAQLLDAASVRMALRRLKASSEGAVEALTPQEHRIFDLIGEGCSNRQIANQMCLAEKTVKNYVSNMLHKLGMSRRTQAAAFAARLDERRRHEWT